MRKKIPIDLLLVDHGILPREKVNQELVDEYAEILRVSDMPPPDVFYIDVKAKGQTRIVPALADGLHRVLAHKKVGHREVLCEVKSGRRAAAVWHAAGANLKHGLRMTTADKRRAVERCLAVPDLAKQSDAVIAEQCGVSRHTVLRHRQQLVAKSQVDGASEAKGGDDQLVAKSQVEPEQGSRKVAGRDGKVRDVSRIGKGRRKPAVRDGLGREVPEWATGFHADAEPARKWLTRLSDLSRDFAGVCETPAGELLDRDGVLSTLEEVTKYVSRDVFWCTCPLCSDRGGVDEACESCDGRGWHSRRTFDAWHELTKAEQGG